MAEEQKKYGVKEPNDITDRDKDVVTEVIELMRQREGVPTEMFVEELKTRFQIVEIPIKKIEDSIWGQMTKDERLGQSVQGFRNATIDGKKVRIPHVGFSADLDYLDEFINRLVKKIGDIKKQ